HVGNKILECWRNAKLPAYDRQLIQNAVEDYGGSFTPDITSNITHMIALTESGIKYDYIMEHPELEIKIVLPHWFQLCCNMRRLLPETIYQFPNPPMLNPDYLPTDPPKNMAPQLYSNSVKSVALFLSSPSEIHSLFLDGYKIFFGEDLNIIPERRANIEEKITEAGGIIVNEYSSGTVDIVICRFRIGRIYIEASRDGKIVASADWLLHVLQTGKLPSPKASLLHYPIPHECIPGMNKLVITISNYTGSIREYLKRMIVAMGAVYKPTLSNRSAAEPTTHLICGNASGDKYEKGHEWNVKLVNHLWLEDCFQAWSLQSETKPRYTLFPVHNQLSFVFGTHILPEALENWTGSDQGDTPQDQDQDQDQENPTESTTTIHKENSPASGQIIAKDSEAKVEFVPNPPTSTTPKSVSKKPSTGANPPKSDSSVSNTSAPSSPMKSSSVVIVTGNKEGSSSSTAAATESPTLGSVRVVSKKRGAAVQASKVLQKIVPDMNEFQDEIRDEKKASKKKKKHTAFEESAADEGLDMDVDDTDASHPTPKIIASPSAKRSRTSFGSVGERSTPVRSDNEDDRDDEANTSGPRTPVKKQKRSSKGEKEDTSIDAINTTTLEQSPATAKSKRVRYIGTGLKDQSAAQTKALKALGILPTTAVEKCTHLVATSIARTGKFLSAILLGKIIVHEDWLQACIDANSILDEDDYRIKDTASEQKFGMNLYESLDRAREKRVFENCVFYLSPSMNKDMPGLKSVVEAGGGKASTLLHTGLGFLKDRVVKASSKSDKTATTTTTSKNKSISPRKKDKQTAQNKGDGGGGDEDEDEDALREKEEIVAVVSSEKDKDMWKPILDAGAHVYSHDLISVSVLTQKLDLGPTHALA
ncbi:hypothetical protein BGZ46_010383, partial [Entomortierella lignicola]